MVHAAHTYPAIIVQNDAASSWPVQRAIASWGIAVTYGMCRATVNCVRIENVSTLPSVDGSVAVGETFRATSAGQPSSILIQLADHPVVTWLQKLQDTAHEFGHALGLGHDEVGVMHPTVSGAYPAPDAAELARFRSLYLN